MKVKTVTQVEMLYRENKLLSAHPDPNNSLAADQNVKIFTSQRCI